MDGSEGIEDVVVLWTPLGLVAAANSESPRAPYRNNINGRIAPVGSVSSPKL